MAGQTYMRLAEVSVKLESRHDAANAYVEAAKALVRVDRRQAIDCMQRAVGLYTDMGRLSMAARQLRDIGDVLEKEGSKEESLTFYEQAGDLFSTENSTAEATKCFLKVAHTSAELERYERAVGIFETAARAAMDNNLLRYSAKGYLLCAGLCALAGADLRTVRDCLVRHADVDHSYEGSREHQLISDLADATEQGSVEAFTDAVQKFDAMTRLDPWKTTMLVRAKRRVAAAPEGGVDEEDLT